MEERAAEWLAARRRAGMALADWPAALKPATEAAGYEVQARTMTLLQPLWGAPAGWKIGVTTKAMQDYLGISAPIAGRMPALFRRAPGVEVHHAAYCRIGIETEIALVLKTALAGPVSAEEAARAVGQVHPAIELVDDRYGGDYSGVGVPAIIADFAFHAGFVLGGPVAGWETIDLGAVRGTTRVNGKIVGEGFGRDVMGHPFRSLAWLAGRLAEMGQRLEPGEVVMTGSLPLPYWAKAGDRIQSEIERLGTVTLEFV
ncbi:MAG TPA: fumarylacetoacetate hydrolase family protein [Stellaceae bacterium]|nr:fumarylacetoacetate hydrolase family protein [Stellaceae bacterium]